MNIKKKVGTLLLLLGTWFLLTMTAGAEDNQVIYGERGIWTAPDGTEWDYVKKGTEEAAIYGVSEAMMELEIPSRVYDENDRGLKVTAVIGSYEAHNGKFIATKNFQYRGRAEAYVPYSISFPDSVSYIGESAFNTEKYYSHREESPWRFLSEIVLPQNPMLVIGEEAFYKCFNLQKVTFRAEMGIAQPAEFGEYAFAECTKLSEFVFPKGSTAEPTVLYNCHNIKEIINAPKRLEMCENGESSLEKISYQEGLEGVYGVSFGRECINYSLKTVVLPASVKILGASAFKDCASLTNINLPEGLETIGGWAFYGCVSLNSFTTLPSTLQTIDDRAFMGCKNLHLSVTYPAETDTCYYQFKDSGITDITFHNDMYSIMQGAFTGCKDLRSIQVEPGNKGFYSVDGVLYIMNYRRDANGKVIEKLPGIMVYPAGKSYAGSYTIPNEVRALNQSAFDSCKFTEIRIPVTVEVIFEGIMGSLTGIDVWYSSFDNMVSECPLYVVKNSCADLDMPTKYQNRKRYMPGNPVQITYQMGGGKNNKKNPSTFVGGDTIHLNNPVKKGYRWRRRICK